MMKTVKSISKIICIVSVLFYHQNTFADKWIQITESDSCNILVVNYLQISLNFTGLFMSDKGLYYYGHFNSIPFWHQYSEISQWPPVNFCIRELYYPFIALRTSPNSTIVCFGVNVDTITRWTFQGMDTLGIVDNFAVLLLKTLNNSTKFKLYYTSGNTIFLTEYDYNILSNPVPQKTGATQTIKSPQNSFGSIRPFCSSLHAHCTYNTLYAGGYDLDTTSGTIGSLLELIDDSMVVLKKINVTSLDEGKYETDSLRLLVGTRDSGVIIYSPDKDKEQWSKIPSPDNNSVIDVISINKRLIIATEEGVYIMNGNEWKSLGTIPSKPNCLGRYVSQLYAGTERGLFIYSDTISTNTKKSSYCKSSSFDVKRVSVLENKIVVDFYLPAKENVCIQTLSAKGRMISKPNTFVLNSGNHTVHLDKKGFDGNGLSNGIYFLHVHSNSIQETFKLVLVN